MINEKLSIWKTVHGPIPHKKELIKIEIIIIKILSTNPIVTAVAKKIAVIGWTFGKGEKAYFKTILRADKIAICEILILDKECDVLFIIL